MDENGDDDSYVTIGTAFDVPEEDEPLKKPSKIQDQIVVDKQGRRRFHGAFTGGFSAGYFNTVGSKEGWTPSTFVSSRSKKNDQEDSTSTARPEDFMDEEDFADHGIAPRQLKTTTNFKSTDDEISARKRNLQKQADDGYLQSSIPGGMILDELILPSNLSMGMKLLKKMGWKQGQGIGEKTEIEQPNNSGASKKVYGCMRPEEGGTLDMSSLQNLLAPKDLVAVSFQRKDNLHGIGYSGIDPYSATFTGSDDKEPSFRPTGKEKIGIRGQAFGIGAFEEEDDDVYNHDNLSNYDITMTRENENDSHGWSGAPKYERNKGCLEGFVKSTKVVKQPAATNMISVPHNYVPKHTFDDVRSANSVETTKHNATETIGDKNTRHKLSSKERSLMLGETAKTLDDVSKWTLRWDKTPDVSEATVEEKDATDEPKKIEKTNNRFSSRWDKEIHQERPKQAKVVEPHQPSAPVYDPDTKTFRPFAKFPAKQARYEAFLLAKKKGQKPQLTYDRSVTEWERGREFDEFTRASVLYRPLTNTFSSRFTPATAVTSDDNTTKKDSVKDKCNDKNDEDMPSDEKAAKMGMFGKLTRTTLEWHPEKLLCKRFNIPDPYPQSKIIGVPGRGRKTNKFFDTDVGMIEGSNQNNDKNEEVEKDFTETLKTDSTSLAKKSIKIGPLSHLNKKLTGQETAIAPIVSEPADTSPGKNNKDNNRPSIDIFKAIFDDSDSSDDDELEDDENPKNENVNENKPISEKGDEPSSSREQPITSMERTINSIDQSITKCIGSNETIGTNRVTNSVETTAKKTALPLSFLNKENSSRNIDENTSTPFYHSQLNKKHPSEPSRQEGTPTMKHTFSREQNSHRKEVLNSTLDRKNDAPHKKTEYSNNRRSKKYTSEDSSSDEQWEESSVKKSSKKKKKLKKHKKEKKDSSDKHVKHNKRKSKKGKRDKSPRRKSKRDKQDDSFESSSNDESFVPSTVLLLQKLKQVQESGTTTKRPSAADFM